MKQELNPLFGAKAVSSVSPTVPSLIDLLIVEDHHMFREAVVRALEPRSNLKVIGHCGSAAEALQLLTQLRPHVILLDIGLGSARSLDFVTECRQAGFEGRILAVTAGVSSQEAVQLVRSGVAGIMHKTHSSAEPCSVIERIAAAETYLEPKYLRPLFQSVETNRRKMTDRERAVLELVTQGLGNAAIAEKLTVTESAAKSIVHQLFKKLGVRSRTQLIGVALQEHFIDGTRCRRWRGWPNRRCPQLLICRLGRVGELVVLRLNR